jgi:transposase
MLKVHMKISGCFRDIRYAQGFCRMRGYLFTCKKHGINASDAIRMLYHGQVLEFITERLSRE